MILRFITFYFVDLTFRLQGQCKPNAIELARIAEVQPVLADFRLQSSAKKQCKIVESSIIRFIVKFPSNHIVFSSNFRQNRLLNNVPERITQQFLRIMLHPVVHLTTV